VKNIYAKSSSKDLANKRLKVILIQDRACLDDKFLETIKGEIMNIIAKYVHITHKCAFILDGNSMKLIWNSIYIFQINFFLYI